MLIFQQDKHVITLFPPLECTNFTFRTHNITKQSCFYYKLLITRHDAKLFLPQHIIKYAIKSLFLAACQHQQGGRAGHSEKYILQYAGTSVRTSTWGKNTKEIEKATAYRFQTKSD